MQNQWGEKFSFRKLGKSGQNPRPKFGYCEPHIRSCRMTDAIVYPAQNMIRFVVFTGNTDRFSLPVQKIVCTMSLPMYETMLQELIENV